MGHVSFPFFLERVLYTKGCQNICRSLPSGRLNLVPRITLIARWAGS
jgi:hypothetical protein